MLKIEKLCLQYGQSRILNDISMDADVGKVTCIMGTNGVGKTSLLKAISGAHHRSSGNLYFDGQQVGKVPSHKLANLGDSVTKSNVAIPMNIALMIINPMIPS